MVSRDLVVVTLVVVVVVTLVVVSTDAIGNRGHSRSGKGGQVDGLAFGVNNLRLAERYRERLRASDFADHARNLAILVEDLDELAGLHAVLRGTLNEVLRQLVLADLDLFFLGEGVEEDLVAEGRGARQSGLRPPRRDRRS